MMMDPKLEIAIWVFMALMVFVRVRRWAGPNSVNTLRIPLIDWILSKLFPPPRETVIGFGPMIIKPGESGILLEGQPMSKFKGDRLIIPSSLCNNFEVMDVRVADESQMISANPIPAAAFSELANGVRLGLALCEIGQKVFIRIRNTTDKDQTFSAALIGFKGRFLFG